MEAYTWFCYQKDLWCSNNSCDPYISNSTWVTAWFGTADALDAVLIAFLFLTFVINVVLVLSMLPLYPPLCTPHKNKALK